MKSFTFLMFGALAATALAGDAYLVVLPYTVVHSSGQYEWSGTAWDTTPPSNAYTQATANGISLGVIDHIFTLEARSVHDMAGHTTNVIGHALVGSAIQMQFNSTTYPSSTQVGRVHVSVSLSAGVAFSNPVHYTPVPTGSARAAVKPLFHDSSQFPLPERLPRGVNRGPVSWTTSPPADDVSSAPVTVLIPGPLFTNGNGYTVTKRFCEPMLAADSTVDQQASPRFGTSSGIAVARFGMSPTCSIESFPKGILDGAVHALRPFEVTVIDTLNDEIVSQVVTWGSNFGGSDLQVAYELPEVDGDYLLYVNSATSLGRSAAFSVTSGVPTFAGDVELLEGDIDGSGEVDAADIDLITACFGLTPSDDEWNDDSLGILGQLADLDGSEEVDAADMDVALATFGEVDE